MKTTKLEIGNSSWLELNEFEGGAKEVYLSYIEHSPDHRYSNSETNTTIDIETAKKIIEFLTEAIKEK